MDDRSIDGIERLQQNLVIEALVREQLATITLDFDGSVLGTCRHAEGVANGSTKKRKASAATIPCTAPLRKQRKCSLFFFASRKSVLDNEYLMSIDLFCSSYTGVSDTL